MGKLRRTVLTVLLAGSLAGCGSGMVTTGADDPFPVPAGATTPATTTTAGPDITDLDAPPPFRVRYDDQEVVLRPHTFCFGNGCADGAPPRHVVSVGSPSQVQVFVPVEGWDLEVTFTSGDAECGRRQSVRPDGADGWFVLEPVGRAGDQRVDLFASGEGGDMIAAFDWRTTEDGQLPAPTAVMSVIADHDGRPDSYGVELSLVNLAATPETATAQVTVTAATGRSLTFDAHRMTGGCLSEGSVYFDGPDGSGREAAGLDDFPFTYVVSVTIDGSTHRATARYPDDEIEDNEPNVRLDFDPPLPAVGRQPG
jgi:hypothetical protein